MRADAASNNVKDLNEYIEFSRRRVKSCRKVFWANFAVHAAGCLATIIATAVMSARVIAAHGGA